MITKTIEELVLEGSSRLGKAGIPDAKLDARLLLEYVTGWNATSQFLHGPEQASEDVIVSFEKVIAEREKHIPLQHITGVQEFMGLEFQVNENVLVPRQDTETLVEMAFPLVENKTVLDMCTGSGCIAVSLAVLGKPAKVVAADISAEALCVAKTNAERNHAQITFISSDLFAEVTECFDVIVSNPPYIVSDVIPTLMPEVKEHEPMLALDGGQDGLLFYRKLAKESLERLYAGGWLVMEIGYDQGESVSQLLWQNGYCNVNCEKDFAGNDRVVKGQKPEE